MLPVVMTPGASFTLVTMRGVAGDRTGAAAVILGTALGIATHAVLAGVGLAGVVMRSAELYHVIRLVGAAYLVGLGVWMVWHSGHPSQASSPTSPADERRPPHRTVMSAYAANVLNVKAAAVYLTLAPQFIPADRVGVLAMLGLAACHVAVMVVWLGIWGSGLMAFRGKVDLAGWKAGIERLGGAVLVALGVRTAVAR